MFGKKPNRPQRSKRYTVIDPASGRQMAQAGPVDAHLWRLTGRRGGHPVRVERTELCPACGLHRCGPAGTCAEK